MATHRSTSPIEGIAPTSRGAIITPAADDRTPRFADATTRLGVVRRNVADTSHTHFDDIVSTGKHNRALSNVVALLIVLGAIAIVAALVVSLL